MSPVDDEATHREAQDALRLRQWEIWYSYASFLTDPLPPLEDVARNLVTSGVAECAVTSEGLAWWARSDDAITHLWSGNARVADSGQLELKFTDQKTASATFPKGITYPYALECLAQAAELRFQEFVHFAGNPLPPPYVRAYLGACTLGPRTRSGSAIQLYPQLKIFSTGVVLVELRALSPDRIVETAEFIDKFVTAPQSYRFVELWAPVGLVAWIPSAFPTPGFYQWTNRIRALRWVRQQEELVAAAAWRSDTGDFTFDETSCSIGKDIASELAALSQVMDVWQTDAEPTISAQRKRASKTPTETTGLGATSSSNHEVSTEANARTDTPSTATPAEEPPDGDEAPFLIAMRHRVRRGVSKALGRMSAGGVARWFQLRRRTDPWRYLADAMEEDAADTSTTEGERAASQGVGARSTDAVPRRGEADMQPLIAALAEKTASAVVTQRLTREPETVAGLALAIMNVAAFVACSHPSGPRRGRAFLLRGPGRINSLGSHWTGRPHIHLIAFDGQAKTASENVRRFGRPFASILGKSHEYDPDKLPLPPSSRPQDDFGVYLTKAATLWIYPYEDQPGREPPQVGVFQGHSLFDHQVQCELLEYGYALNRRIVNSAAGADVTAEKLMAAQRDLSEFELSAGDTGVFLEIRDLLATGWRAFGVQELRANGERVIAARATEAAHHQAMAGTRWNAFLALLAGMLAVPPLSSAVLEPLWKWRHWPLPHDPSLASLTLVGVATGIVSLVLLVAHQRARGGAASGSA
jgi:hypothetical protein